MSGADAPAPGHGPAPDEPRPSGNGGRELAAAWLLAARDPRVVSDLEGIYAEVAGAIAERGPACWASGRCCNFRGAGHRLYVTGLEAAYTIAGLDRPGALAPDRLAEARARGDCPLLVANLCSAHTIKPLGCRVYFCDRSAQAWQQDLTERALGQIKALHERYGIEYRYGEWVGMLGMFEGAGSEGAGGRRTLPRSA